jgi:hypothetical protein
VREEPNNKKNGKRHIGAANRLLVPLRLANGMVSLSRPLQVPVVDTLERPLEFAAKETKLRKGKKKQ